MSTLLSQTSIVYIDSLPTLDGMNERQARLKATRARKLNQPANASYYTRVADRLKGINEVPEIMGTGNHSRG